MIRKCNFSANSGSLEHEFTNGVSIFIVLQIFFADFINYVQYFIHSSATIRIVCYC